MSFDNWKDKIREFQIIDVRHLQGNFFEGLKNRAEALEVGEGLGYEHHTEQKGDTEFRIYFYRTEKNDGGENAPFKPLALLNYPMIDEKLGQIAMDFWETTWQSEMRVLPTKCGCFCRSPMPWVRDGCGRRHGNW